MNDPENQPSRVAENRAWLIEHKTKTGFAWSDLGKRIGIAQGTLSQFGSPKGYAGDEDRISHAVARYRQALSAQAKLANEAPQVPDFFPTETSDELTARYRWAQRGKMVAIAAGPGTGKTITARQYQKAYSNVWIVTLAPSSAGVNTMQIETLAALGERDAKGTPQALSRRICDRVRNSSGLIIIDEAQNASERAIEEMRSWYDSTGIGLVLQGNETVISRLEGGSRRAAFAQIYSRISMRLVRALPTSADAYALANAWGVEAPDQVEFIRKTSMMPGGLRGCSMMLELATMFAQAEAGPITIAHMSDAWSALASRPVLS